MSLRVVNIIKKHWSFDLLQCRKVFTIFRFYFRVIAMELDQNKSRAYISSRLIRHINKQLHNMMQSKTSNDSNDNWSQLAFLEAFYIKNLEPCINEGIKISRELDIFLWTVWSLIYKLLTCFYLTTRLLNQNILKTFLHCNKPNIGLFQWC